MLKSVNDETWYTARELDLAYDGYKVATVSGVTPEGGWVYKPFAIDEISHDGYSRLSDYLSEYCEKNGVRGTIKTARAEREDGDMYVIFRDL